MNTPIISTDLILYNKKVTAYKIKEYQCRIGSLFYMAMIIYPDIIFAILKLLRFLTNPSPTYV